MFEEPGQLTALRAGANCLVYEVTTGDKFGDRTSLPPASLLIVLPHRGKRKWWRKAFSPIGLVWVSKHDLEAVS